MRISAIIPTFNRAKCIAEAVASVLNQSLPAHEVIVVDDGSTDATAAILKGFGDRIRLIRQPNGGVSSARNTGIRAAEGDWIAFLDSDDVWTPDKLRIQAEDLQLHPNAIAHATNSEFTGYETGQNTLFEIRGVAEDYMRTPLREHPLLEVLSCNFFVQAIMVNARVLKSMDLFRTTMSIHEDIEVLSRVALTGPFVVNTRIGVQIRRVTGVAEGLSNQHVTAAVKSMSTLCELYENLLHREDLHATERAAVRARLSASRVTLSKHVAQQGDRPAARRILWQSTRDDPSLKSFVRASLIHAGAHGAWQTLSRSLRRSRPGFRRSDRDATSQ